MNKKRNSNTTKLSNDLSVTNVYRHVVIKRPNGLTTVCRSAVGNLRSEANKLQDDDMQEQNKLNKDIVDDKGVNNLDDMRTIYVNVDFTKHTAWCGGKRQIRSSVNDQFVSKYKHTNFNEDLDA